MIKTKYLFGVLSLATCLPVFAQDFLSLQQCREMALSYNQDLKAATHKVTAYEALHRSAKSDLYPKISASGDATYTGNPREFTFTKSETPWTIRGKHSQYGIGVNIEQPLYQGGGLRAQVRKSAAEQEQARLAANLTGSEVILESDRIYWNFVACQELLQIARQYYHTTDSLTRTIAERVEAELTDRSDLLMAEVKRNDAAYRLRESERQWDIARMTLASFIGLPEESSLQTDSIVKPLYQTETQGLQADSLFQVRPEYGIASRQIDIQNEQTKINRAKYLPRLTVGATGQYGSPGYDFHSDMDPNYQLYAKLNVPVFEWGKRKHQHTADKSRTEMAREQASKVRDQLTLEIQVTAHNQDEAVKQVTLTESSVEKAHENSLLSLDQYKEGLVSITEVLDAQIYYLEARKNFVTSKYNAQIARSEYLKASGSFNM